MQNKDHRSDKRCVGGSRIGALLGCLIVVLSCSPAALAQGATQRPDLVQYAVGALLVVQILFIVALLVEEKRRRRSARDAERLQSEVAHAARLALAGEITASIAHEITQPLSAILSNVETAELLLRHPQPNAKAVADILADIKRDDLRANEIVQRLRTLLRKRQLSFERVDIGAIVGNVVALIKPDAARRGVLVRMDVERDLPSVDADSVQLQQVLLNLGLNAMDAMAATPPARRQLDIQVRRGNRSSVEVAFTDAGSGMTEEQMKKAFESFFTTKEGGMGLGLSIARSIIHMHGGTIWAEPARGGGTTFRLRIPQPGKHSMLQPLHALK